MKSSLAILAFFAIGLAVGAFEWRPSWLQHDQAPYYALLALLFLAGVAVGGDADVWQAARRFPRRVVLIPAVIVLGTFLGVAPVALLLPDVSLRDALAVGSCLGYYSLSSILITELQGERLGVLALLANLMRELLTLVLAPLLVRYWRKLAPIAAGAATAMDTTLPVIVRFAGVEYATIAIFTGVVLMLLAPLLVTLVLSLGF